MLVDTGLTGLSKKKEQGPKAVAIEGTTIILGVSTSFLVETSEVR
jgi:hypothetical protein